MLSQLGDVAVALTLATIGAVTSLAASVLAVTGDTSVSPWVQVGGTATAVGALAYVAKLLADGRLVAQPIAELIKAADRREETLKDLVHNSHNRETDLRTLLIQQRQEGTT